MICSDRVLDPALKALNGKVNKYSVDFTEFAVAWVISNRANHANFVKNNVTQIA